MSARERRIAGPLLALAAVALLTSWLLDRSGRTSRTEWVEETRQQYQRLWTDLQAEAAAAARVVPRPQQDELTPPLRLEAFRRLGEIETGKGRHALLLLDADGVPVAWAGEGLLHELPGELLRSELPPLPPSGLYYRASFSAVTLLAIHPLDSSRRPWRIVAGASYPNETLPFPNPRNARWSLVDSPAQVLPGTDAVTLANAPTLVVERGPAGGRSRLAVLAARLAWIALGLALLALAVVRGLHREEPAAGRFVFPLVMGGLIALAASFSIPLQPQAVLLAGVGLAALGLRGRRGEQQERDIRDSRDEEQDDPSRVPLSRGGGWEGRERGRGEGLGRGSSEAKSAPVGNGAGNRLPVLVKGAAAVLLLFLGAWALVRASAPLDLAGDVLASAATFALRLGFTGAAFGLLILASRRGHRGKPADPEAPPPRDRLAWIAVALLLTGAAACDQPWLAVPLLAAGGAAAALWADVRRLGEGMAIVVLVLLSVFAAAGVWETAYRLRLRSWAGGELLVRLAPPARQDIETVAGEIHRYFLQTDLQSLVPRDPGGLERQDLAYVLWKDSPRQDSPLARHHSLSALVVVGPDGLPASSFSFGMPLTDQGAFDPESTRWDDLFPLWKDFLISGEAPLLSGGRPWGKVRYWMLPRPGFEVHDTRRLSEVDVGLLKGGPVAGSTEEIAAPALYALYAPDRRAVLSPWDVEAPLPLPLAGPGAKVTHAVVETPGGPARAWARVSPQGWEAIYLPFLEPLAGLERLGNWSLGVILLLALAAPPILLLALPRAAFRDVLRRTVRSYSKRLMIIYTVLLLIPLVALYFVLVSSMEERLRRDQRAAGEAALNSVQQLLGEELLKSAPGFGVDTVFGDRLLVHYAGIVRHEVNLYFGSAIHASSRHELFTAGLLPKRIPGEIYRSLALLGYGLSSRTNRVGDTTYLEMYAPLRVPGTSMANERLFLSMPLLAQQEEGARQLNQLRRHGLLVTAALFALLVAVGRTLARSFTRPLMQLVLGTRRIAAGAPSLDLAPTELELAALVEAVDEMARKIAEGRERLVREKQVVERMVENITSGIVSLDRERRVLLHNRVAAELLGTAVGESLEEAVERSDRLAPIAAFLRTAGAEMERATVRLSSEDGGGEREWSLIWVPLPGAGEPSALLVVEDATEILRGQRLLAWAEMARMIAHEIKNPLTPIRLSAEHMMEVYHHDPDHFDRVFERCTVNILTQVDELRSIASEFSAYSSIPRIDPQPADLVASMADLVEGYRAAPPQGVEVDFDACPKTLVTRFDAKLLGRAVRNLIENALRASAGGGRVVVRIDQQDGYANIAVQDSGPGVPPDLLPRIFDPYFSTHDTGTGLGLPIARRIAEEHGGDITARNRPEGGLEVVVTLPV